MDQTNPSNTIKRFVTAKVLSNDSTAKTVALLGKIVPSESTASESTASETAVLLLEKIHFTHKQLSLDKLDSDNPVEDVQATQKQKQHVFPFQNTAFKTDAINDIYLWSEGWVLPEYQNAPKGQADSHHVHSDEYPDVKFTLIYPAAEKHIAKYTKQQFFTVHETPGLYNNISKKFIENEDISRVQWMYNILDHKSETERILLEDQDPVSGFILLPDYKWDMKNLVNIHLIALAHNRDIRSLRSFNSTHLPLLKNIKSKVTVFMGSHYPELDTSQLLFYVHYHPTYYHLHVHISNVNTEGGGTQSGRAHLIDQIIDNIENISPDYYQKATITVIFGENNKLYRLLTQNSG